MTASNVTTLPNILGRGFAVITTSVKKRKIGCYSARQTAAVSGSGGGERRGNNLQGRRQLTRCRGRDGVNPSRIMGGVRPDRPSIITSGSPCAAGLLTFLLTTIIPISHHGGLTLDRNEQRRLCYGHAESRIEYRQVRGVLRQMSTLSTHVELHSFS